jgi:SAM-dependent methyltransferase
MAIPEDETERLSMDHDRTDARWGTEMWKEKLVYSRRSMWAPDTIEKLARWMGIKHGMTAVDCGCGLGYLGYTYWPYFGEGSHYYGTDGAPSLLLKAAHMAEEWARGGNAVFVAADAHRLPFPDNSVDWVMCQAVLMHIPQPGSALREMVRVARPDGLIACTEEDQLATLSPTGHSSLPEPTVEEDLLLRKGALLHHKGRIKLGRGDNSIGPKIPSMMKGVGLVDVDVRTNDRAFFLHPPYEGQMQQDMFKIMAGFYLNDEVYERWRISVEEAFLAAGGTQAEHDAYRAVADRRLHVMREQLRNGTFSTCHVSQFHIVKGRKPE